MLNPDFRFPGVLNSKEMLVAEAIHARAWNAISSELKLAAVEAEQAKAALGGIVVRLMVKGSTSVSDLSATAIRAFKDDNA